MLKMRKFVVQMFTFAMKIFDFALNYRGFEGNVIVLRLVVSRVRDGWQLAAVQRKLIPPEHASNLSSKSPEIKLRCGGGNFKLLMLSRRRRSIHSSSTERARLRLPQLNSRVNPFVIPPRVVLH